MRILAYQGISWVSRVIRWQTRSRYSHIAIEVADNHVYEAWHVGGVQLNAHFRAVHTAGTMVDVFAISAHFDPLRVRHFLDAQIGKRYDFRAVARFLSRRNAPADDRWFCSELAVAAFRAGGLDLLARIPPSHVSPRDVIISPHLDHVAIRTV